jgi:hypothetical protein
MLAGGLVGLLLFLVDAAATVIRVLAVPSVAERATAASVVWFFAFLLIFVGAGMLAGWMWAIRREFPRFVCIGAVIGATIWSYLSTTWPLTARAGAVMSPQGSVLSAVLAGAALGALGGGLLFAIGSVRNLLRDRH